MRTSEIITILALLIAPFLAIFAQKQIETWRARRQTKLWIFKTLMATRAATLSTDHVQALNMIDLEFSEKNGKEKHVRRIWQEYLNCLYPPESARDSEAVRVAWIEKCDNYLTELLVAMGQCFGYDFDKVYIQKGIYRPIAHAEDERESRELRAHLLQILQGERRFPVGAVIVPDSEDARQQGEAIVNSVLALLEGTSTLKIEIAPRQGEEDRAQRKQGDGKRTRMRRTPPARGHLAGETPPDKRADGA